MPFACILKRIAPCTPPNWFACLSSTAGIYSSEFCSSVGPAATPRQLCGETDAAWGSKKNAEASEIGMASTLPLPPLGCPPPTQATRFIGSAAANRCLCRLLCLPGVLRSDARRINVAPTRAPLLSVVVGSVATLLRTAQHEPFWGSVLAALPRGVSALEVFPSVSPAAGMRCSLLNASDACIDILMCTLGGNQRSPNRADKRIMSGHCRRRCQCRRGRQECHMDK